MRITHISILLSLLFSLGLVSQPGLTQEVMAMEQDPAKLQPLADPEQAREAQQAFEKFIRAYETGNMPLIRQMMDPSLIGYQRVLDGIQRDMTAYKQIRIHLKDTKVLAGPDVTVIQTRWEKRFLSVTNFQPGLHQGEAMFLMHKALDGWKIAAMGGDNLVAGVMGTLAQLSLTPSVFPGLGYNGPIPYNVEVRDSDMTGKGSLSVVFSTRQSSGQVDRETFTLPEVSPGRFFSSSLNINGFWTPVGAVCAPVQGDNNLEVCDYAANLPATITMRYVDRNPGNGMPARTLTRTVRVQ